MPRRWTYEEMHDWQEHNDGYLRNLLRGLKNSPVTTLNEWQQGDALLPLRPIVASLRPAA